MAGTRKLKIEIVGDASGLSGALDGADKKLGGFSEGLGKIAKVAAGAFAADKLVSFGMDAAKASAEDQKSQKLLADQLQKTTGASDAQIASVEKFITKTQNATGVMDDNLRPALATLVRSTGDATKAQDLLQLSLDISAGTGKDVESVSLALSKAYNGNVGGLSKLGLNVKDASGKTLDFVDAQAALNKQFGGAAATAADTAEGKYKIMQARFADLKEEVGAKLLPILSKLAEWMSNTLIPAVEQVVAWFDRNWPQIQATITNVFNNIVAVVSTAIEIVRGIIETVTGIIQAIWSKFGTYIVDYITAAWDTISGIVQAAVDVLMGIFNFFKDLFTGQWSKLWGDVLAVLTGIWDGIKAAVQGALDGLLAVFGAGWEAIKGVVLGAVDSVIGFVKDIPGRLASFVSSMWDGLKNAAKGAFDDIVNAAMELPGRLLGAIEMLGNAALQLGKSIANGIAQGVKDLAEGALDVAKAFANTVIDFVNKQLIHRLNSLFDFKIPMPWPFDDIHVNFPDIPDIPKFHSGGVVPGGPSSEMLAVLQGGEMILTRAQQAAVGAGMGGNTFVFTGPVMGEQDFIRRLYDGTLDMQRRGALVGSI